MGEENRARHEGLYSLLECQTPGTGGSLSVFGVLLQDREQNRLFVRCRRDLAEIAGSEEAEVLEALADDLRAKAGEMGAEELLHALEDTSSNAVRVTDRQPVAVDDYEWSLNRLYRQHVPATVRAFRTHVPVYTLRAAAGRFLDNDEIEEEGWEEVPESLRTKLEEDMFVAHIAGHSMEPRIPDGSLCLFRAGLAGSREGRLVLAEDRNRHAFAIKRYRSEKQTAEEGWKHARIRLESLNPEYPSWDLEPDEERYRILAEFLAVLG